MFSKQIQDFKSMIKMKTFPHILLVGTNSCNIKFMVKQFLEELYGKTKSEFRQLEYSAYGKKHTLNMESHSYYRIISLNRFVHCDQSMMDELVREFTESIHMGVYQEDQIQYRTVVVQNVGYLSNVTQASMRRLIERVHVICRFIFCTSNVSSVIDPLRSRCIVIRLPNLSLDTQKQIISDREKIDNPKLISDSISENSLYSKIKAYDPYAEVVLPWEERLRSIADWCMNPSSTWSTKKIAEHRLDMYTVMRYNISGTYILKCMLRYILSVEKNFDYVFQVVELVQDLEKKLKSGNKDIFYLEYFVVNIYRIYQKKMKSSMK
jgi:replication factor C subunit 3/5